jgi:hypothetical protein
MEWGGERLEQKEELQYLGSITNSDAKNDRIQRTNQACYQNNQILTGEKPIKQKMRICKSLTHIILNIKQVKRKAETF